MAANQVCYQYYEHYSLTILRPVAPKLLLTNSDDTDEMQQMRRFNREKNNF